MWHGAQTALVPLLLLAAGVELVVQALGDARQQPVAAGEVEGVACCMAGLDVVVAFASEQLLQTAGFA